MPWVPKSGAGDGGADADDGKPFDDAVVTKKGNHKSREGHPPSKGSVGAGSHGKGVEQASHVWGKSASKGSAKGAKDDGNDSASKEGSKGGWSSGKGASDTKGKGGGKEFAFGGSTGNSKGADAKTHLPRRDGDMAELGKGFRWPGKGDSSDFESGPKGVGKGGKKGKGKSEIASNSKGGGFEKPDRTNRSEDSRRQVLIERGQHSEVKKHSSMGCAVVTMSDARVRQAILNALGSEATISGIKVKVKAHTDKDSDREVPTDLFVGWGRQVEKATPLAEADIAKFFDQLHNQMVTTGRLEDLARASSLAGVPGASTRTSPTQMATASPGGLSPTLPAPQQSASAITNNPYYAAHQAQYMAQMQQHYQYLMMCQQQQAALAYYQQQALHQNQAAPHGQRGQHGGRQYKAAYRYPSDDEVKNRLQRFQGVGQQTKPEPSTAEAATTAAASADAPELSQSPTT
mmetsp:Transcript_105751/g.207383  ORF Transcript_105751/g.207383 Transcript_105751/m.207383 type:complete len:460 (+) Transcript_105751:109-1488(+)|eukprot:CAMPEP_0170238410 /NCGR_PEP_ID=MMETSP0116_2-20130129/18960_1 /TAXON_ID=400756 /ORGANISM="Durinskia baltica, Strain CSIRO CS-38" /LENGTH=459 /DNA_ID=CAMNT_0010489223 /DNA_START=112 /DNA_END=1491 /DNA_ORIENTATION=-